MYSCIASSTKEGRIMKSRSVNLSLLFLLWFSAPLASSDQVYENLLDCFSLHILPSTNFSQLLVTPDKPSYSSLLNSSIRNLLFVTPTTHKPFVIISPIDESHVQAAVICCREQGVQLRVRSGGHDYEGLSYRSETDRPFAIADLANLRSVDIDLEHSTAWVQSGATLGELYYRVAERSKSLGFPAGICPTVGVGGHVTGGGFGTMLRKYGLAVDQVLDAKLVDANGRLLDRESMGEDLFWAIGGGGGSSFGVVVSWKVKLVPVPLTVSVFNMYKTPGQGAIDLVNRWQHIAHRLHGDLFIRIVLQSRAQDQKTEDRQVVAQFNSLFLGDCSELLQLMGESFPELRLGRNDCREMSWIDSIMYFAAYTNGEPMEILLDRGSKPERFFLGKSDFVTRPIPRYVWEEIWGRLLEEDAGPAAVMILDPFGGKMSEISETATPFPHRKGNLYNIQYFMEWKEGGPGTSERHIAWIRRLYSEMTPYVSKHPRAAYLNYRDLDLGVNEEDGNITSYSKAKAWGKKYFKNNFARLAMVKGRVDPYDFFRYEQSIPPLFPQKYKMAFQLIGLTERDKNHNTHEHQALSTT